MDPMHGEMRTLRKRIGTHICERTWPLRKRHKCDIKRSEGYRMRSIIFALTTVGCITQPTPKSLESTPVSPSAALPVAPVRPRIAPITVAIVIDQFAAWVARDRLPALPENGGFARLRKEGTWYQDVRFAHAITDTAPGHASLFTGKVPRDHGIVANELWVGDHPMAIVADDTTRAVVADGTRPEFSASLRAFSSEVVADRFKASVPNSRVYALSLKDRAALPGGGHHPDLCLWFDPKLGQFLSSTALTQKLPDWVVPALGQAELKARLDKVWMPSQPDLGSQMRPQTSDGEPGEGDFAAYGAKFPHQPSHSTQPFAAFRSNPESDRMLLELGVLALDNTPTDVPVLLAISLSASDYIGHIFGPDSWEAKDELVRLDASLAWFFEQLDKRRGAEHWNLVLSADHGIVPLPEVSRRESKAFHELGTQGTRPTEITERVTVASVTAAAKKGAAVFGKGNLVAGFVDPYLYLTNDAKQLPKDRAAALSASVVKALQGLPCVERVFDTSEMSAACPPYQDESLQALVCRSIQPGKGGEYYVSLKPGCFYDTGYVLGYGTSHGNAELADRSVPLMVRATGKVAAGKVETAPQSFELFSRELIELLGAK